MQSDAQPSDSQQEHASPRSGFSFKAWWAEQQAAGRRNWERLREWWRKQTAPVEVPPSPKAGARPEGLKPHGLANTARIAVWAPTAVFLALCEAAIATAIAFAVLVLFREDTVTVNRVIATSAMVIAFTLSLFWFANAPNVPTTTKRFWTLFHVQVLLLGIVALAGAIALTLQQVGLLPA